MPYCIYMLHVCRADHKHELSEMGGRQQLLLYIIQHKTIGFNPFLCGPGCEPRYGTVEQVISHVSQHNSYLTRINPNMLLRTSPYL